MSQSTRIRDIIAILEASKYPVPLEAFLEKIRTTKSTFKRDLDVLRDQMQAPIEWKAGNTGRDRGYVLQDKGWSSGKIGLPRAWFTATEIYALLMIDELAHHIGPGLLTEHLQPLIERITLALSTANDAPEEIRARVRILASASMRKKSLCFEVVAQATVKRQQLTIVHFNRSKNERSERTVSPQRLVHYRENWYLISWCHRENDLRMFALDAIEAVKETKDLAKDVPAKQVDDNFGNNFGIYTGTNQQWAKLKFTPLQARWAEAEVWHSEQKATILDDGSYILEIPYSNPKELMLEILRFGQNVQVLEPAELRSAIINRLKQAVTQYE